MTNAIVPETPTTREQALEQMKPSNFMIRMADQMGVNLDDLKKTIKALCLPSDASNQEFLALMIVAEQIGANPFLGEIYAFRNTKTGKIQPIVGKNFFELAASRHLAYNGCKFRYIYDIDGQLQELDFPIDGFNLVSIGCEMHRTDRDRPEIAWAKLSEYNRPNVGTWKQYPTTMLEHKAFIKAGKKALGWGDVYDPDEAARFCRFDKTVQAAIADVEHYSVNADTKPIPALPSRTTPKPIIDQEPGQPETPGSPESENIVDDTPQPDENQDTQPQTTERTVIQWPSRGNCKPDTYKGKCLDAFTQAYEARNIERPTILAYMNQCYDVHYQAIDEFDVGQLEAIFEVITSEKLPPELLG